MNKTILNNIKVETMITNLIKSDKKNHIVNNIFETNDVKLSTIVSILKELHLSVNKIAIEYLTNQLKNYNIILTNDIQSKKLIRPEVRYISINDYTPQIKVANSLRH